MKKLKPIASLLLVCLLLAVCCSSAFAEGTLDTELPVRVITLASRSTPTLPMSRPLW